MYEHFPCHDPFLRIQERHRQPVNCKRFQGACPSFACLAGCQFEGWKYSNMQMSSKSCLFTSRLHSSFAQITGANPRSATCPSRYSSSINLSQPRWKNSQRILSSDTSKLATVRFTFTLLHFHTIKLQYSRQAQNENPRVILGRKSLDISSELKEGSSQRKLEECEFSKAVLTRRAHSRHDQP